MKLLYFIRNIFLGIGVVLMLIYYTITAALCYPFQMLKYRRTAFYRETGIPFSAAKDTSDLQLHQMFRDAGLPVRYLPPTDLRRYNGWFLYEKTLVLHMFDELSYSEKLRSWTLFPDETLSLADTVANQLRLLREVHPEVEIDSVRILLCRMEIDPEHLPRAEQDATFLIYGSGENPADALRRFCN